MAHSNPFFLTPRTPNSNVAISAFTLAVLGLALVTDLRHGGVGIGLAPTVCVASLFLFVRWALRRRIRAIEVGDESIRFVAPRREVVVRWDELRSVAPPRCQRRELLVEWRWDGGRVTTGAARPHATLLADLVEAHAPRAEVRGLRERSTWGL